jgi:hypothetical protein
LCCGKWKVSYGIRSMCVSSVTGRYVVSNKSWLDASWCSRQNCRRSAGATNRRRCAASLFASHHSLFRTALLNLLTIRQTDRLAILSLDELRCLFQYYPYQSWLVSNVRGASGSVTKVRPVRLVKVLASCVQLFSDHGYHEAIPSRSNRETIRLLEPELAVLSK